jgi:hypothetical protein
MISNIEDETDLPAFVDVYVVLSALDGQRWLVDKVQFLAEQVQLGRIDPREVMKAIQAASVSVGRVFGSDSEANKAPGDRGPGRFGNQRAAIAFAMAQADILQVFAQVVDGQHPQGFGDFRKVARSEAGADYALGDNLTHVRLVIQSQANPARDVEIAARLRRDLWARSAVAIDPNNDSTAIKQASETNATYFEFETDFPDEVDRVVRQYGYSDQVSIERGAPRIPASTN